MRTGFDHWYPYEVEKEVEFRPRLTFREDPPEAKPADDGPEKAEGMRELLRILKKTVQPFVEVRERLCVALDQWEEKWAPIYGIG